MNEQRRLLLVKLPWEADGVDFFLARGWSIVLVLDDFDAETYRGKPVLDRPYERIYRVSALDSLEEVAAVAVDLVRCGLRFDRMISSAEFGQYGAGVLCEMLGIGPRLADSVAVRDKRIMKRRLELAGVPVARQLSIPDPEDPSVPSRIGEALGYPVVMKPANGFNARYTRHVASEAEARAALAVFVDRRADAFSCHMIAEEFIVGDEFHADAVWIDGKPGFSSVSRYFHPMMATDDTAKPDGSYIVSPVQEPDLCRDAERLAAATCRALGIRDGVTHFEFFRHATTGRLVASEIATRVAGGGIDFLFKTVFGVSLFELQARAAIDGYLTPPPPLPRPVGWLNLPTHRTGVASRVPSEAELRSDPAVLACDVGIQVGDPVLWAARTSTVTVVFAEQDEAALAASAQRIHDRYPIEVAEAAP